MHCTIYPLDVTSVLDNPWNEFPALRHVLPQPSLSIFFSLLPGLSSTYSYSHPSYRMTVMYEQLLVSTARHPRTPILLHQSIAATIGLTPTLQTHFIQLSSILFHLI